METRQQGATLFSAIVVLIGTLVVVQLWLVAASVDAVYRWDTGVILPAAIASIVLFLISAGLLWYVVAFDARLREWGPRD